ncbi:replicative DNA helicase [Candidatus Termititenax dinenymphae]|uniref:Replicative DNA helicase n=1 Tax=Candidatus Termititenax dinenymphae TaxID=2218523 RepID=A0A388TKX7_9BACT|nr:replicative DNA helicase [Candidatus Termititenax dinenymphae]
MIALPQFLLYNNPPMSEERIPPQNIEAEQSLLGCLLHDSAAVVRVMDRIRPEFFYLSAHTYIFQAIQDLTTQNKAIDLVTVAENLKQKDQIDQIGGRDYLAGLDNSVISSAHAEEYAEIVERNYVLRSIIGAAQDMTLGAYQPDGDPDNIVNDAQKIIFELAQRKMRQGFVPLSVPLGNAYDNMHNASLSLDQQGIMTQFKDLDHVLGGFQNANMIVIAARPSVGKTTFAMNIAVNAALKQKAPIGIFSLEMTGEELAQRMLCTEAEVNSHKIKTNNLNEKEQIRLSKAFAQLSAAPIFLDASFEMSIVEIQAKARKLKAEHNIKLLIVDFLTMITSSDMQRGRVNSRYLEISGFARSLKALSKELNIPIIVISQLNREGERQQKSGPPGSAPGSSGRGSRLPRMSDLRESGEIEQVADVVLLIHRESYQGYLSDGAEEDKTAQIIIAKNRNGPASKTITLAFHEEYTKFDNWTNERPPDAA